MRLPTQDDYDWVLAGLTPAERLELDAVALDIAGREIDGADPLALCALASVFAHHAATCADHLRNTALELSACLFDHAARLRERAPVN